MTYQYSVRVDGDEVWSTETDEYEGTKTFPDEYRQNRPESGVVELVLNGEVIGRQISQADEDAEVAATTEAAPVADTEGDN